MKIRTKKLKMLLVLPLAIFIASYAGVVAQDLLDDYYINHPRVLIDASRDGGLWWYPQPPSSGGFDPLQDHQGKPLADYLKSQGMLVDELPRPYEITHDLLQKYDLVVRAGKYHLASYSDDEISAYSSYVSEGGQLVLISDYTLDEGGLPDTLAEHFGIFLAGSEHGYIYDFTEHPITTGITSIYYNHGSILVEDSPPNSVELGFIDGGTALGILPYGYGQIFFMGDIQSIFSADQPLTENVFTWFLTIEGLASQVLVAELDAGAEKSLLAKLDAAFKAFDTGRTIPFENQVEAFINQVEALLLAGRIDPATADTLVGTALTLIRSELPAETESCPCWTEEQINLVPVPGEEAICGEDESTLAIGQSGCEHDFAVFFGELDMQCVSNRYCIKPYGFEQYEINESELEICASQIRDRCKSLKIKLPK